MKRFFTTVAFFLALFAVKAQDPPNRLYIMGGPFSDTWNWNLNRAVEMERDADNMYVFYYRGEISYNSQSDGGGEIKLLLNERSWANNYHPENSGNVPLVDGGKIRLGGADSKWTIPEDGTGDGFYVVKVNTLEETLDATRYTPSPPQSLYITGGPFGWSFDNNEMERDIENPYLFCYRGEIRYNTSGEERGNIKFSIGKTWDNAYHYHPDGSANVPLSEGGTIRRSGEDTKWTIPEDGAGDGYYVIKINTLDETIEVEKLPSPPLYIVGGPFNRYKPHWLVSEAIEMERDADDPYIYYYRGELHYNTLGVDGGNIKFLTERSWVSNNYHPDANTNVPLLQADKIRLNGADTQWTIPEDGSGDGYYTIKVNLTEETIEVEFTDEVAPNIPTNLTATPDTTSITLTWTASIDYVGVAGYIVYLEGDSVATITDTAYTFTDLMAEKEYTLAVSAFDVAGNRSAQASATATIADVTPPSAPTGLTATPATASIALTWTASTDNVDVAGYVAYLNGDSVATVTATGYTFADLGAGEYTLAVSAFDAAGNRSVQATATATIADVTPPSAPADLATTLAAASIALTWTASTDDVGVVGYIVYLEGDSVATVTATAYTVTGLAVETQYTLAVVAFDAAGNRSTQTTITVATTAVDVAPPSAPTNLAATPAAASIALTWTASTDDVGVVGYIMYLDGDSVGAVTAVTYTFAGLTVETEYTLAVVAFDAAGKRSTQASITSTTTADVTPPSVPAGLAATPVAASIALTWTASTDDVDVTGYVVYLNDDSVATVAETTYTVTGLTAETQYTLAVAAFDAAGNRSAQASITSTTTADATPPSAPADFAATSTATSITLTWTASTDNVGVAGYVIYLNSDSAATVTAATYTFVDLNAGEYTLVVVAFDAAGNRSAQVTVTAAIVDAAPPSAPADLAATSTATSITLTWTASTDNVGVAGYVAYLNGDSVATVTATGYTFAGLTAGKYTLAVAAFDAAGNRSAQASIAATTTPPESLYIIGGPFNTHDPNWMLYDAIEMERDTDNPFVFYYRGEIRYNTFGDERGSIKILLSNNSWGGYHPKGSADVPLLEADSMRLDGDDTKWTISEDGSGDGYYVIKVNVSEKTIEVEFTPKSATVDTIPPSVPADLAATSAAASITMTWTASTDDVGVAGYIVYLNGDSVATVTATAYTIADLTAETEYTLAVAAFDAAGNRSAQATITAATTAENLGGGNTPVDTIPPSVPADLAATPAAASITLTWTASTDDVSVAGYVVYLNGDSVSTVTATVYTFADLTAKTQYTLAVAAFDAEGNRSAQATITAATTAAENPSSVSAEAYGLKLYPNPVHTELNVSLAAEIAQVELVSLTGGKVLSHNVHGSTSYVLSLQGVAAGSYVLVVTLRNGDVITQIIVKQ